MPSNVKLAATASAPVAHRGRQRALLYTRAAAFAVIAAFALTVFSSSGSDSVSGRLGGDFPAFYAAGSIAAEGDWAELYEPERQLEAQQQLLGSEVDGFLYFAYPPHAALAYQPFASLDYRVAYAAHTLLMVAATIGALALVRPMVGYVERNFEMVATGALLFYPMLRSVTGGQNTALSLLGLAAVWRLLHDEQDAAAGLVMALLLFKPQFAIPLIGLMILTRRWRAVGSAAAGATILWIASAGLMGVDWLGVWWGEVANFTALDATVNGHNAISWLGVSEHVFGQGTNAALVFAAPLVLATIAVVVWIWVSPGFDLGFAIAGTCFGLILMSPHAMFYDAGLLVLAGVVLLDRMGSRARIPIALCWMGAWLQLAASGIDFAPLFAVILAAGAVAFQQTRHTGQSVFGTVKIAP